MFLRIKHLGKTIGDKGILKDISIDVAQGDIFGLLGPNGAGKSTTLRICLGLQKPTKGEAWVLGEDVRVSRSFLRSVGSSIEQPSMYPSLTALAMLQVVSRLKGVAASDGELEEVLETVGLHAAKHQRTKTFSQGMKQRLALAYTLVGHPLLLILDEPTNGLDPKGIRDFRDLLLSLNRDHGLTLVISSHSIDFVKRTCNRLGVIAEGETRFCGSLADMESQGEDLEGAYLNMTHHERNRDEVLQCV